MNPLEVNLEAYFFRCLRANKLLGAEQVPSKNSGDLSAISSFSPAARGQAKFMGEVYELLYCLENSIRELIETTLSEAFGPDKWWSEGVGAAIRKGAEKRRDDDARARWHGPRGDSLLSYVDFPQYADIILAQWPHFEALLGDEAWVRYYFEELNRTRRALAHTGRLTEADVERMEVRVRDWLRVVG
jgi:hypothetical protein